MGRIGILLAALWFVMSPLTAAAEFACTTEVTFPETPEVPAGTPVSVDTVDVEVGQQVMKGDALVSFSTPTVIMRTVSPLEGYITNIRVSAYLHKIKAPKIKPPFVFIQVGSNPVTASLETAAVCPPEQMSADFTLDPIPAGGGAGGGLVATPPGTGIAGANKDALNGATKAKAVVGGVTALVIGTIVDSMTDDNNPTGTSGTVSTSGN